jgi:isopentenyldiphosphate isomerase
LITESDKENNYGIRLAAQRRLKYELNLTIDIEKLIPVEKILYRASSDDTFEEYESIRKD